MALPAPLSPDDLRRCVQPFERARTLPAAAYTDEAVAVWERRVLFESAWTCAGRSDQLGAAGDQMGVRVGDEPVLLTRDRSGALRAFSNVCRHRGFELRPCDGSVARDGVVRCSYHRWTYGLDGSFRGGPDMTAAPGFDRGDPDHGLVRLHAAEWGGWMFVCCADDPDPLPAHLGNLAELAAPYECERLAVAERHTYLVEANWKLLVENYSECYHCAEIHPELCRVTTPGSGIDLDATGRWVGGTMLLDDGVETMSLDGRSPGPALPRLTAAQRREVLYLALMPNLLLSLHPDYVMTHRLEPRGPDRTEVECAWLFPREEVGRPGFSSAYAADFWDLTNRQDWAACEGVQRGARGRGFRQAPFAQAEFDVYQVVRYLAETYLSGRLGFPAPLPPQKAAS